MGKTLLISGGARGIGRATTLLAAAAGWNVAFTYLSDQAAAKGLEAQVQSAGGKALAIQGDVKSEGDVQAAFAMAERAFCSLDAVVVNAGIVGPSESLAHMTVARMSSILDTNVLGALLFAREAARKLPESCASGDANIVFVGSAASRLGSPFEYVDYAASKGAIDTLTIGLSQELAPSAIRVNAVRPGLIDTEIHASSGDPARAHRLGQNVPLTRPGMAEEVAEAILWLCSDKASYSTGSILDVAGGR